MFNEGFVVASCECSTECAVVEVGSLENARFFGIAKRAQFLGSFLCLVADNVIVDIKQGKCGIWLGIGNGCMEETESWKLKRYIFFRANYF